eukprot:5477800-Pleurochrysis_carterae.AAC.1
MAPPHGLARITYADVSLMVTFIFPCFAGICQPARKRASVRERAIGPLASILAIFAGDTYKNCLKTLSMFAVYSMMSQPARPR